MMTCFLTYKKVQTKKHLVITELRHSKEIKNIELIRYRPFSNKQVILCNFEHHLKNRNLS